MKNKFPTTRSNYNYIINRRFQLAMLLFFILVSASITATTYFFINLLFYKLGKYGVQAGFSGSDPYFALITRQKAMANAFFVYFSIGCFIIVNLLGIVISHHIAGPIYRLGKTVDEAITSGNFEHISWRSGDFFPELAGVYNRLVDFFNRPK
ncbi:MAG: hypothetical protein A2504_07260 [Bdellovibrionales bacterium RIFOXYD12_FULL_39_22]|nr:MAG: hypothetical protein A2385_16630 [Bdellovibrionales bacterium RIFOXYB1_FULL_39_21]OFZ44676.1 MAG: hypothetical protein A2485_14490 [Bdellovibrionales bacterium RIFOXYC12_FULL_39_17]OFZ49306.1 MAG: hypothetical protein A2404_08785 [Bdellovibrionales bacterium RIFOXYC1_FULL_39_130]OFZ72593.1 MAG: hypothetical protein A2451_00735 [Bdellovibrionales bacterium RIFOXYC2_FULL_39_8]OFZ77042.1 MAG: hypothetical protein A2560_09750 [Bdellovibrionales bacterium RIFOXYD1_FULL_39_84]OFZ95302.1 MAG: